MLGAVLLDNEALDHALEFLIPDDFYREAHRKILRAMIDLSDRNEPVDPITLTEALRTKGELETDRRPHLPRRAGRYGADRRQRRPLCAHRAREVRAAQPRSTATEIASGAYEAPADVDQFLDDAEHKIFDISERRIRPSSTRCATLTRDSMKAIEGCTSASELVTGVPTGFTDLDRMTAGCSRPI